MREFWRFLYTETMTASGANGRVIVEEMLCRAQEPQGKPTRRQGEEGSHA